MEGLGVTGSFWAGRRVLVTGHTGFKGGWLALWLESLGAQVTGLGLSPSFPSFFQAAGLDRGSVSVIGDIRDYEVVLRTFRETRPEIIFHLAAQPLVRASYRDPVANYATNVLGTVHVLEAARQSPGVRAVVVVTSDKCYENRETREGYREADRLGGHDPYSSSKACAEIISAAYRSSYFTSLQGEASVAVATTRAGNVIGGGDWAEDRLVPDLVRAIAKHADPEIRNPAAVRPWQHVLEPLWGYLMLAERLAGADSANYREAWNFGPMDGDAREVGWIVERFSQLWGRSGKWIRDASARPHEAALLTLDTSKARTVLGWKPVMDLEQALAATVRWYQNHLAGKDMRACSLEQIGAYTDLVAAARSKVAPEIV